MNFPDHWDILHFAALDSTNAEARRRAEASLRAGLPPAPLWIVARTQRQGRGRRGRHWQSNAGGFYATLSLVRPNLAPSHADALPFLAALSVFDALRHFAPTASLALKWPNDILLGEGKIAGVLVESVLAGGRAEWLGIGIGINLRRDSLGAPAAAPQETEESSLCLAALDDSGVIVSARAMLEMLALAVAARWRQFGQEGFPPIRRAWLERAAWVGERVAVQPSPHAHDNISEGVFESIDACGALQLRTAGGLACFHAADVSLRKTFRGGIADAAGH